MKQKLLLLFTLAFAMVFNVSAQMYTQVSSTLNVGDIYYMTKGSVDGDGVAFDQAVIDDLEGAGYNLTLGYPADDGSVNPVDLNKFDLVLIGRNISSSQFKLADAYDDVEVPILMTSAWIIRNNRLKYVNSDKVQRESATPDSTLMDVVTRAQIADVDEYAYKGVADAEGKVDYMTWFYDYIAYGVDSFATTNNGKVLASIVDADTARANGNLLIARWAPGVETYDGSGVTPNSYRTYFMMGGDAGDPKSYNYAQYTEESFYLLLQEINWLIRTSKTVSYMTKGSVDGDGVVYDKQVIDDLNAAGYTNLEMTYPADDGSVNPVELNKSDLVIIGRNISSSQFKLADAYDEVEAPILMTSAWIIRNNRLKYVNSDKVQRESATPDSTLMDVVTKALVANASDSAFIGVPVADSKMDYMTWFYDYIAYGVDTFVTQNNATLLASIVDADTARANGNLLMARWAPGVETYAGSGVTPMSYRTYMMMGGDAGDPKSYNYAQYTDASFTLLLNELAYLSTTYAPSGVVLGTKATLDTIVVSDGTLDPAFSSDVFSYTVALGADATVVPTVTYTLTDTAAIDTITVAEGLPGTTMIKVTSEDLQTTNNYIINFTKPSVGDWVEPGMGTLEAAVLAAADGDVLKLKEGGTYDIVNPLIIDKKLTIIATKIVALPGLSVDTMPLINNTFVSTQVFGFKTGADLTLVGINVDGNGGSFIFNPMSENDSNYVLKLNVNRCRLHNTVDDTFNDDGSNTNNISLGQMVVTNTFLYDNGSGHGIYTKHFGAGEEWKFENITMWKLGQQFSWIRINGADDTQKITFDHITGYNLSTSTDNKELFGNDEKAAGEDEANLDIMFSNNLLSSQGGENEFSLIFKNTDNNHTIAIKNNVLHACKPMGNVAPENMTIVDNIEDQDPGFADAAAGDFTVSNTALFDAASDGKIVGALYWHPDFVDTFADLGTGVNDKAATSNIKNVVVYPNPCKDQFTLSVELTEASNVSISVYSVNGQLVSSENFGKLSADKHDLNCKTNALNTGIYFYQVLTDNGVKTGKIVKN